MTGLVWLTAGAALVVVVLRRVLLIVRVHGGSMRPTFADRDLLLAHRLPILRRGSVVVFRPPGAGLPECSPPYRVKRLAALPGDPTPAWVHGRPDGAPVPDGAVVVRGDHHRSEDSRTYGYIRRSDVFAVVVCRLHR
ncbi:MAG TPA: S26 family signal peptidase [Pseudonocardiaceae bacterium]